MIQCQRCSIENFRQLCKATPTTLIGLYLKHCCLLLSALKSPQLNKVHRALREIMKERCDKTIHLLDSFSSIIFQLSFLIKVHYKIIISILIRNSIYFENSGIKQSNSRSLNDYNFRNLYISS